MKAMRSILLETVIVVVAGVAIALVGNQVSGKGLKVDRDYFPLNKARNTSTSKPSPSVVHDGDPADAGHDSQPADATTAEAAYAVHEQMVIDAGLQPISFEEVKAYYQSSDREYGGVLFIDARKDDLYRDGHIAGALQCNRMELERYIDDIVAAAEMATTAVIVYCDGGECEDSLETARMLQTDPVVIDRYSFDPAVMFVYVGGMEEWRSNNGPIEKGVFNSGQISGGFDE